ncbi:MAG: alcohol dehydrogenase catalytic domain-containing protein [Granulosicoccus sp.]|nr:alcohol dehydrogenase catalytic domain-containing protein [Granulosicoccus sp.]
MKALVYTNTLEMEFRDEPEPDPKPGDALIKVSASGICGSDMHAYHGLDERRIPPLILGHEAAGTVMSGPEKGRQVAINPLISCGHCHDCLGGRSNLCASRELIGMRLAGAFADYVCVPSKNLIEMPANASMVTASLMEPTAVSLHAVMLVEKCLHRPLSECRALVIGGGAIGLLAALILAQKGTATIVMAETNAGRRATVASTGCCEVFDPLSDTGPDEESFDIVIDAVGSGATRAASCRYARPGSVISHIGLQDNEPGLDTRRLTLQEITFIGNYTYNPLDLHASLAALTEGKLGTLDWVETRPLASGGDAFRSIHEGTSASPKIVLLPD